MLTYGVPWQDQGNDYKPVVATMEYLSSIGMDESFAGGIVANGQELHTLVTHLSLVFRCNAALPPGYFTGMGLDMVGDICKYGNLHLYWYDKEQKEHFLQIAPAFDLIEIEQCFENFSVTGAIEGRTTVFKEQAKGANEKKCVPFLDR